MPRIGDTRYRKFGTNHDLSVFPKFSRLSLETDVKSKLGSMVERNADADRTDTSDSADRNGIDALRKSVPIQIVLPTLPPGSTALISPQADGSVRVDIAPPLLAYTLEEACARLPNRPHPDTLRAQLERAGIAIGMCGRTPLVSEAQLIRGLRLGS